MRTLKTRHALLVLLAFALAAAPVAAPFAAPSTAPSTSAAGQVSPETEKRVRELVRQLSDDQWRKRNTAEKELVGLGPDVESLLRELAREVSEPEASARLKVVIAELAGRRWTGPTLVTLRLKDAPPRQVFEELFRQAGAEFSVHPVELLDPIAPPRGFDVPAVVSVDYDRTPFWAALKDVCNKTGMNARNVYDRHRITLTREPGMAPMKGPAVVEGAVMVVAEGVNLSARIQFVNPEGTRQRSGSLSLQVYNEPRLRVTRGYFEAEKLEDDQGEDLLLKALLEARPAASSPSQLQQTADYAWQVAVPMRMPSGNGTKVRSFRGKLHLLAHAETRRAEVADVLNAKEQTREVGGKRFTLHAVTKTNEETYNVQMTLFRDNMGEEDWAWFRYPYGRLRLLDARGRDLSTASGGGGGGNDKAEFAVQYRRESAGAAPGDQPGEPFTLAWDLPVKTQELVVPVAFEDLPLP
jgi:hypothetical protein